MKENELFKEIRNIVRRADGLAAALARVQALLTREFGAAALLLMRPRSATSLAPSVVPGQWRDLSEYARMQFGR